MLAAPRYRCVLSLGISETSCQDFIFLVLRSVSMIHSLPAPPASTSPSGLQLSLQWHSYTGPRGENNRVLCQRETNEDIYLRWINSVNYWENPGSGSLFLSVCSSLPDDGSEFTADITLFHPVLWRLHICLCLWGERAAAGERGQPGEAAGDGRAVWVAVSAAALLDVLHQEVGVFSRPSHHIRQEKRELTQIPVLGAFKGG